MRIIKEIPHLYPLIALHNPRRNLYVPVEEVEFSRETFFEEKGFPHPSKNLFNKVS